MPPRRSRRTDGQDPNQLEVAEKLEVVEKGQGKPGEEEYVSKIAAQGEEIEADAAKNDVGSSSLDAEKIKLDVEETDEMSTINKEDSGKKNSAEHPDEASGCGEVLQVDDGIGEKVALNSEKDAQSTCRLGDPAEPAQPGPSGERGSLNASKEEFYSGEEEVAIKT